MTDLAGNRTTGDLKGTTVGFSFTVPNLKLSLSNTLYHVSVFETDPAGNKVVASGYVGQQPQISSSHRVAAVAAERPAEGVLGPPAVAGRAAGPRAEAAATRPGLGSFRTPRPTS